MDPALDCEAARRELVRGRALVSQLKATLERSSSNGDTAVGVLMEEISRSLIRALDALNSNETRINLETAQRVSLNTSNWTPSFRSRDECIQKILTTKPFEDAHSWKKYGQKIITGAAYPRCYFKCCLRKDEGCKALKQVQQTEVDPAKFLVTYIGQHTCTSRMDASSPPDQCFLSFGTDCSNNGQVQNWSVGTSNAVLSDPVTARMASEMIMSASPNPSDSDSVASLFESGSGFYYDDNSKF